MGLKWLMKCCEEKSKQLGKRASSMWGKKKKRMRKRKKKDKALWGRQSTGVTVLVCAIQGRALSLGEPACCLLRIIFVLQFVLRSNLVLGS